MNQKIFVLFTSVVLLVGCATSEYNSSNTGLENIEYSDPDGGEVATLQVVAPSLKERLWIADRMSVSFFNSCTDEDRSRKEGYVGSFELSSDESVGRSRTVKIPANETIYVEVGYAYPDVQCTNKFAINAKPNETYRIVWEYLPGRCYASGLKLSENGEYIASMDIEQRKNEGSFWKGASGRTTSGWRSCNNH